jgi:ABC-type Zn uptake system ZnuABC Zn-binding protein ZnuA
MAEQIAREFGGRTVLTDPIGGAQVPGRQSYVDLMRYNARAFAEALK